MAWTARFRAATAGPACAPRTREPASAAARGSPARSAAARAQTTSSSAAASCRARSVGEAAEHQHGRPFARRRVLDRQWHRRPGDWTESRMRGITPTTVRPCDPSSLRGR